LLFVYDVDAAAAVVVVVCLFVCLFFTTRYVRISSVLWRQFYLILW